MKINQACSEIINRALSIKKKDQSQPRETAVALDILNNISQNESTWRQPIKQNFLERILRPIRNLICTKAFCQYQDIKNNLSAMQDELSSSGPIIFKVSNLNQQSELHHIRGEANGLLHAYTQSLEQAVKNSDLLNPQMKNALSAMIKDINRALNEKKLGLQLPTDLSKYFNDVARLRVPLDAKDVPIENIYTQAAEIQEKARLLPGYANSTLEEEIQYTFAHLEAKQQLLNIKKEIETAPLGEKIVERFQVACAKARDQLQISPRFAQLNPEKKQEIIAAFTQSFNDVAVESYQSVLNTFKITSQAEIRQLRDRSPNAFDALGSFSTLTSKIWSDVALAVQELDATEFGKALKVELTEDFEKLSITLGKDIFNQTARSQNMYNNMEIALNNLEIKVHNKTITADELIDSYGRIEIFLAQLDAAESNYNDIMRRIGSSPDSQKSQFFQDALKTLLQQNNDYKKLLSTHKNNIQSLLKKLPDATLQEIADKQNDMLRILADNTVTIDNRSFNDITAASNKSGWIAGMALILGTSTGSQNLLKKVGVVDSTANKIIGAAGTFAIYAMSGYLIGKYEYLSALAYGAGAASLALLMPTINQALPESWKKLPVVTHVTGPLIMATYAFGAPVLATTIFATGATPLELLKQQALQSNKKAAESNKQVLAHAKKASTHTNQTATHIENAIKTNDQALNQTLEAANHTSHAQEHIQSALASNEQCLEHVEVTQNHAAKIIEASDHGQLRVDGLIKDSQKGQSINTVRLVEVKQEFIEVKKDAELVQTKIIHVQQAAEVTKLELLAAREETKLTKARLTDVQQDITLTQEELLSARQEVQLTNASLTSVSKHAETTQKQLEETTKILTQMKDPQRGARAIFMDTIKGSGAIVAGGITSIFFDPITGGSLMGWGASTIAGHGYTGT